MTETRVESSYLDYFLSANVNVEEFKIEKPFTKTDHWVLKLKINEKELGTFKMNKTIVYDFKQAEEDEEVIYYDFIRAIEKENKIRAMVDLVQNLRKKYKPRIKKKREMTYIP